MVTVQAIKSAFDETRGKDTGRGYIYQVLERHAWRKVMPRRQHPKKGKRRDDRSLEKINESYQELKSENSGKRVSLMFQDEAGFGRIHKPKSCWCPAGVRPVVPCHHIREYRYAFGAVEPATGDSCFRVISRCDTVCMNAYLRDLSATFSEDIILLGVDGAGWHKSKGLVIPPNIVLFVLPAYTPEMNPIEQIWKEIRARGFKNEVFATLAKVDDRLCDTICSLTPEDIKSITGRGWILSIY
jgi:putative transposase